jgi:hypothetical protein
MYDKCLDCKDFYELEVLREKIKEIQEYINNYKYQKESETNDNR